MSPHWLETKSRAYGHPSVVADFRRYLMVKADPDLKLLLEAFQRAAVGGCGLEGTLAVQMASRLMAVTTSAMIKVRRVKRLCGMLHITCVRADSD